MKRYLLGILFVMLLSPAVVAQEPPVIATSKALGNINYLGIQASLTPTNLAASTLTVPTGATAYTMAVVTVETGTVRFWVDGTAPTTSTGHLCNPGDMIFLHTKSQVDNFKVISTTATYGVLMISYGKP